MSTTEEAAAVIKGMDGQFLDSKPVSVVFVCISTPHQLQKTSIWARDKKRATSTE